MPMEAATPGASELIDHLYAALFSERPWQTFLDQSVNLLPNGKTVLFYHDKASGAGAMSLTAGLDEEMVRKFNSYYHSVNPWVDHAMIRPLGKVMQADEMLPREELKRTAFFNEYLLPQGVETGVGVTLHRHDKLHFFFSLVSADATDDQVEIARRDIGLLVPHLDRAIRVQFGAAAANGDLSPRSAGTIQLDARLKIVSADARALFLLKQTEALRIGPLGRLACEDPELLFWLHHLLRSDAPPAVQHRHVRRKAGALPLRVFLYRPGSAGSAILPGAHCFMQLHDPADDLPEGVRQFCIMYGLTGAEAGIVSRLVDGLTVDQIAAGRKTSKATVRTQLKSIFWKTGCNRQSDIILQVAVMAQSHGLGVDTPFHIPTRIATRSDKCR